MRYIMPSNIPTPKYGAVSSPLYVRSQKSGQSHAGTDATICVANICTAIVQVNQMQTVLRYGICIADRYV